MGEYVAAFFLKSLSITRQAFLFYGSSKKVYTNREVNPEASGRLRRWYCPPRRDGRVCASPVRKLDSPPFLFGISK